MRKKGGYDPTVHHRRSIRLRDFDYTNSGWYFVTICTKGKVCLFGDVVNDDVVLNDVGKIVEHEWLRTAELRSNVVLDEYVIMPNHFHGIIIIENECNECRNTARNENDNRACRGVARNAPTNAPFPFGSPTSGSLGAIIRAFKSATTKHINQLQHTPGNTIWQRNYYEHIIRNHDDLDRIRSYIYENPMHWDTDRNNKLR